MQSRSTYKFLRLTRYLVCIGLVANTLMGCAPAAFVAGVATGSTVGADKRTLKAITQDQSITQQVQLAWQSDPLLVNKTHLSAASFNRVVLLVGQAPTKKQERRAYRLAAGVQHVRRIYNQIQIMGQSSAMTRSSDAWITTKTKSLLLTKRGVPGTHIKVLTENSIVYLMGIVTPRQGRRAAEIARKVAGVQKVVKLFEYDRNNLS